MVLLPGKESGGAGEEHRRLKHNKTNEQKTIDAHSSQLRVLVYSFVCFWMCDITFIKRLMYISIV